MSNRDRYIDCFVNAFGVDPAVVPSLEYEGIPNWDSVGHMTLITEVEDAFDIMMETDDIIDFSSFDVGVQMLKKYDVEIESE